METNRQTVILFRTKNTNYTYDTLTIIYLIQKLGIFLRLLNSMDLQNSLSQPLILLMKQTGIYMKRVTLMKMITIQGA